MFVRPGTMRFIILASCAICAIASADPAWKKDLSPPTPGPHPPIPSGTLSLQVSWKGILNSGAFQLEFAPKDAKKPDSYVVRSSTSSLGLASTFFPYKGNSWSELDPSTLRPKLAHSVEIDKSETLTTTTRFLPDRVESTETSIPLGKKSGKTGTRSFAFTPVFDICSAILHVRSQKLANGDRIHIVVHPFNNPYLLHVNVIGREKHLNRDTIRLTVGMRKIDRKTLELKPYKKIKKDATLWLSDDADRIPVELRAAVFIGDIRATLASFNKS